MRAFLQALGARLVFRVLVGLCGEFCGKFRILFGGLDLSAVALAKADARRFSAASLPRGPPPVGVLVYRTERFAAERSGADAPSEATAHRGGGQQIA